MIKLNSINSLVRIGGQKYICEVKFEYKKGQPESVKILSITSNSKNIVVGKERENKIMADIHNYLADEGGI